MTELGKAILKSMDNINSWWVDNFGIGRGASGLYIYTKSWFYKVTFKGENLYPKHISKEDIKKILARAKSVKAYLDLRVTQGKLEDLLKELT